MSVKTSPRRAARMQLDTIATQIITALPERGRLGVEDLSARTGLPLTAVMHAATRLKLAGLITSGRTGYARS